MKINPILTSILALFLLGAAAGCNRIQTGANPAASFLKLSDTTPPTVTGTSPADTATNVPYNTATIQVTFSESVDPLTVDTASFFIEEAGVPISGTTVTTVSNVATLTLPAALNPTTLYTVTVTTAVTDLAANALAADYVFSFTTGTVPDVIPPTITLVSPADTATGVSIGTTVTVSFDEAMNTSTVNTGTFTLYLGALPVPGTVAQVGAGPDYEFTPTVALLPNATYTATVTTGVTDLATNALAANYSWTFTTGLVPSNLAQGFVFNDLDRSDGGAGGSATIKRAADESDLDSYVVYWGSDATTKLGGALIDMPKTGFDINFAFGFGTSVPAGAAYMLVYSKNLFGESATPTAVPFHDMVCRMIEINLNDNTGSSPSNFAEYNGKLYFSAWDGSTYFTELWSLDASESLNMAASINPSGHSYPMDLTVYNGKLYFSADDGTNGRELWCYDDSGPTVSLVQDINAGAPGSDPKFLTVFDGYLEFQATDGIEGLELYEYDGSSMAHYDLNPGAADSKPAFLTEYNSRLYFQANDGIIGEELWLLDAGGGSLSNIMDMNAGINNSSPAYLYVFNGLLYFQANDGTNGIELYSWDDFVITQITDINPGSGNADPQGFYGYGSKLYFRADDGTNGYQLWIYDPAGVPTLQMVQINASASSYPKSFTSYNGNLYFSADNGLNGQELWVYDGTTPVTVGSNMRLACDINTAGSSYVDNLVVYNGRLYFQANDGVNGPELWVYYLK